MISQSLFGYLQASTKDVCSLALISRQMFTIPSPFISEKFFFKHAIMKKKIENI